MLPPGQDLGPGKASRRPIYFPPALNSISPDTDHRSSQVAGGSAGFHGAARPKKIREGIIIAEKIKFLTYILDIYIY